MKASELIESLQDMLVKYGDLDVNYHTRIDELEAIRFVKKTDWGGLGYIALLGRDIL